MVQPIQPKEPSSPITSRETPQEKHQLFEIEFLTAVLSDYVAVSRQNGSAKELLSKLKNGLASGQSPAQLGTQLNDLISQINSGIVPGKAKFPDFNSTGDQTQAVIHCAFCLEKLLNAAAEKGDIKWKDEEKLFNELSDLIYNGGQMAPEQAFKKLNGVIEEANSALPAHQKLPIIPFR